MFRWLEKRLIFRPWPHFVAAASDLRRPWEDVSFASLDGTPLFGWFFPADPDLARRRRVLLLLHGNGGNISHRLLYYRAWLSLGLDVFAFDYRGYGRSAGQPSEHGSYADAQAAYRWLVARGYAPEQVLVLGKSLGGGPAAELAIRERIGALILQSTFTSIPELGRELYPWLPLRWLNTVRYDTHSKLPRIEAPVLVMHSRQDGLIGFHHAERNFAATREPKTLWELAGDHNRTLEAGYPRYLEGLQRFLADVRQNPAFTLRAGGCRCERGVG